MRMNTALPNAGSLQVLGLNQNRIGDLGLSKLAAGLSTNTCNISVLWLMDNKLIGDSGATAIAAAIQESNNLVELDLSGNNIACEGARALSETLRATKLNRLWLGNNVIRDEGGLALLRAKETCTALDAELQLDGNLIRYNYSHCPFFSYNIFSYHLLL